MRELENQVAPKTGASAKGDLPEQTSGSNTPTNPDGMSEVSTEERGVLHLSGKRYFSITKVVSEVAQRGTTTSDAWVRSLVKTGDLKGFKVQGRRGVWISEESFEFYFEQTGFEPKLIPIATSSPSSPAKEGDA